MAFHLQTSEKEFFEFIYKRQLIWHKRFILKQQPPWTTDEVLGTYKIINVYRELDKCTQYIVEKLKNLHERESRLLNVILYRFFNQYGLYENMGIKPLVTLNTSIKEQIIAALEDRKRRGFPMFNNAYLISSGEEGQKKHVSILNNLAKLSIASLVAQLDASRTPEESLEVIQTIPMVGPFLGCEIWTDLSYFKFFNQGWNDNDFVNIGPGAAWGLEILYNTKLHKKSQQEKLQHLHRSQPKQLERVHHALHEPLPWKEIAYKDASSNYPFLSITNVEGSLCEFRKYCNLKNGKGKRRYFYPTMPSNLSNS